MEAFLENHRHTILDTEKNIAKMRSFDLGQLNLLES